MASIIRGSGESSFSGSVSIGGTLTYEDVTSVDSVGVITARSGIDIGTGTSISSPANNELALYTNGSEKVRITSAGNIGIGTTLPANSTNYVNLALSDTSGGVITFMQGATQSADIIGGSGLFLRTLDASPITFRTNGSNERMRIDSSGRVGVGTTAPGAALDIKGNYLILNSTSANSNNIIFEVNDVAKGYIGPAGNLGGSDNDMGYRAESGNNQVFYIGSTERARIDSSGNVLIGGTTQATADIALNADGSALFKAPSGSGVEVQNVGGNDGSKYPFVGKNSSGTTTFSVNGDGSAYFASNVGIGTTSPGDWNNSANQLVISKADDCGITIDSTSSTGSSIHFGDGSTGNEAYRGIIRYDNSDDSMRFSTAATEAFRVDSSQRLLVGTSSDITGASNASISLVDSGRPIFALGRNDSTVAADVVIGSIRFYGTGGDGSTWENCAEIKTEADGTHGTGDKPSRLVFSTTADGASSPTERMRIDNGGSVDFTTRGVAIEPDGSGDPRIRADSNPITILAGSSNGVKLALNAGTWTNLSDESVKTDLTLIENGAEKIKQVRALTGRYITDEPEIRRAFLIAQDVQKVLPEATLEFEPGKLGLNYTDVIPLMLAALQETLVKVETLQAKVAALEAQ